MLKVMHISTVNISQTVIDRTYIAIGTIRKSHAGFILADLHLTFAHSNDQRQGHPHLDCECL